MVAIFDARARRMRSWATLALEHPEQSTSWGRADLAYGKLIAVYGDWVDHPRLAAFEASSGKRLWDVALPDFPELVLTPGRVYATDRTRGFRVVDASTGSLLFSRRDSPSGPRSSRRSMSTTASEVRSRHRLTILRPP
jgi:hypothetical protein